MAISIKSVPAGLFAGTFTGLLLLVFFGPPGDVLTETDIASRRLVWLALGGGAVLGGLVAAFCDPKISVYWLWLAVFFNIAMSLPFPTLFMEVGFVPIGSRDFNWYLAEHAQDFLTDVIGATGSATLATVLHRRWTWRAHPRDAGQAFSLQTLLVVTTAFAVVFSLLRWRNAPPVVYLAALIFFSGRLLSAAIFFVYVRFLSAARRSPTSAAP